MGKYLALGHGREPNIFSSGPPTWSISTQYLVNTYPLDSDFSGGWRYPPFEQPDSGVEP